MKYYNYSGKKSQSRLKSNRKKIIVNIIIIVALIALCVAFALILGNHLKNKLEDADLSTQPVEELFEPIEPAEKDPADEIAFVKNDRAEGSMSAIYGYLDLEGCPDAESAEKFVSALKEDGYTGAIFNVRGETGKYSYASKAASEIARTEIPESVVSYDELAAAVAACASRDMRSCAYIDLGDVFLTDETSVLRATVDKSVIKELSAMGFSEIILDGAMRESDLTTGFAKNLYEYLSPLRSSCPGTDFGLVIDPSVLDDPEKTPVLEIIFRFVDLYALDLADADTYGAGTVSAMLEKHSGSFNSYSILSLIGGESIERIRSGYAVFSQAKNPNAAFITPRTDTEPVTDEAGNLSYDAKCAVYPLIEPAEETTGDGGDIND